MSYQSGPSNSVGEDPSLESLKASKFNKVGALRAVLVCRIPHPFLKFIGYICFWQFLEGVDLFQLNSVSGAVVPHKAQ